MEKTNVLKTLVEGVDNNLPTILTGAGEVTWVATAAYSVYAGWKLHEEFGKEETVETKERVKRVAKIVVPIGIGVAASIGFGIAGNNVYAGRLAAAGAAALAVNPDVRDKIEETVGTKRKTMNKEDFEKTTEEKPEVKNVSPAYRLDPTQRVQFRDLITGRIFETSLAQFWEAVNSFNNAYSHDGGGTIADFYRELTRKCGTEYEGDCQIHNDICFNDRNPLDPDVDAELDSDWGFRYTFTYDYVHDEDRDDRFM